MLIKVAGGTGAGSRMHTAKHDPQPWECRDGHANPKYAATCLATGCREKRDESTNRP